MKQLSLLVAALGWFAVSAQDNPASALNLTLTDYLTTTTSGVGCTPVAGSLGATGSGVPTCAGIDNNDVWYLFTATTQAARFTITTAAFDAVAEVLEVGSLNSVGCVNASGANTGEVLRVNTLTIGDDYYLRIHSANGTGGSFTVCGQYYPIAEVRPTHSPTPPTDLGLPGYQIINNTARVQYGTSNPLIQGSRWYFTNVDTSEEHFIEIAGTNSLLQLNAVGGLCFNSTYDVRVEVRVDNYWCGTSVVRQIFTEEFPVAQIAPSVIGQTFTGFDQINSLFIGTGNIFEWRFTTDNGTTQFTVENVPNTTILLLAIVECLRYNRIYTIEVRAQYCGEWGPWSEPGFIFTDNVPQIDVRDEFCNTVQTTTSYINCDFTPNVDSFAWQFAPIDPTDPTMTPIGPAIVTYTPTTSLYLFGVGLTPGTTYRVGAKAIFGLNDGCGTPQEGDYGFFCPITIQGSFGPSGSGSIYAGAEWIGTGPSMPSIENRLTVYPNPLDQGPLNLVLPEVVSDGLIQLEVYDLSGRMVYNEVRGVNFGAQLIQLPLPNDLRQGQYLVRATYGTGTATGRFIVR